MNLDTYMQDRLESEGIDPERFWDGYQGYKIGTFLKALREEQGMTQSELASKAHTTKSAISRMENHAEDIKLSTLQKVAEALGKTVKVIIQ